MIVPVYLAARYSRREELCRYRADLEALGNGSNKYVVNSRWLKGDHEMIDDPSGTTSRRSTGPEERERFATEDWEDVLAARYFINFTEEPGSAHSRGGRHVEMGAALAWEKNIIIVGPSENVFHYLNGLVVVPTWTEALNWMKTEMAS